MSRTLPSADRFLSDNRMHYSAVDMRRVVDTYLKEMTRGLSGERSSLPMIPTYIETAREVPRGERVIALDAGGTNFRAALVSFDAAGKPLIEGLVRHRIPGVDAELESDEFFRAMAGFVLPAGPAGGEDRVLFFLCGGNDPGQGREAPVVQQGDQGARGHRPACRRQPGARPRSRERREADRARCWSTTRLPLSSRVAMPNRGDDSTISSAWSAGRESTSPTWNPTAASARSRGSTARAPRSSTRNPAPFRQPFREDR